MQNAASKPVDTDRFFAINERFHQALLERNRPLARQRMQEHFANGLEAAG